MEPMSANNVVPIGERAATRYESLKQRAIDGIDTKELSEYYNTMVKECIQHFSYLQKYLAEEFLGDIVIESFTLGMEASKCCLSGKDREEIFNAYAMNLHTLQSELCSKHRLFQYFREWDTYSLTIMSDDLVSKWFRKGVDYGQKQRKLRLM
jgi:hypothetical protein